MRVKTRTLILIVAAIVLISAVLSWVLQKKHPRGTQVVVTVNGTEQVRFDLHTDQTIILGPEDGSWYNTLEIKDGKAGIVESDCDNQICVHTPALQENVVGLIVCLPHGLVVELQEPA